MKKLVFSLHAEERLAERGLNEEIVRQVIRNPEFVKVKAKEKKAIKKIAGKRRVVVYKEEENYIKVITLY